MALIFASGGFNFREGNTVGGNTFKVQFDGISQGGLSVWMQVNALPDPTVPSIAFTCMNGSSPSFKLGNFNVTANYSVSGVSASASTSIGLNSPMHIMLTWDKTVPVQKVYTNGALVSTTNLPGNMTATPGRVFEAGLEYNTSPGTGIGGKASSISLQDLVVYSGYVPTQNDVTLLLNRSILPTQIGPGSPSGAICWFTFTGPPGSSAKSINGGLTNSGFFPAINLYQEQNLSNGLTPTGIAIYDSTILSYTYPVVISSVYVSTCSGMIVFLFNQLNTNNLTFNNKLVLFPTVNISYPGYNSTLTLNNPVSSVTTPWIIFPLPSALPPNAVVTYNVPTGMITNSVGTINGVTGYVTNNMGKDVFPYPAQDTVKVGFNLFSQAYRSNQFAYKNYAFRAVESTQVGFITVVTQDDDLRPTSCNAILSTNLWWTGPNSIDGGSLPFTTGLWSVSWQDDPTNSSSVYLESRVPGSILNDTYQTFSTAVISGIRYTSRQQLLSYPNPPTGRLSPELRIWIDPYNTGSINVRNLWVIPPGNSLDTSNPAALDQNIIEKISTNSGKFTPLIRNMSSVSTNNSNVCIPADVLPLTGFTWGRFSTNVTINPAIVRPYSLAVSPSAYFEPYGWLAPSTINYLYPFTANNRYVIEVVTSGAHGLHTGQNLELHTTPTDLAVTGIGDNKLWVIGGPVNKLNLDVSPVVVTGPSSFLHWTFNGGMNGATGLDIKTLTQSYTSGFTFTYDLYNSTSPQLAHILSVSSTPGCDLWFNVDHGASDALVAYYANMVFDNLPPDRKVIVEYTNEHWNGSFQQHWHLVALGALFGQDQDTIYAIRTNQVHNIFDAVFNSGGRPNKIDRMFAGQYSGPGGLGTIINTALANGFQVHSVSNAPYENGSTDVSYLKAIVSGTMSNTHDIFRHWLWYNTVDKGYAATLQTSLDSYFNSTGSSIKVYHYEGSIQKPTINAYSGALVLHDFNYHPEMYRTMKHYFRWLQTTWNTDKFAYFQLDDYLSGSTDSTWESWNMITYPSQGWGKGDGSDGKAINKFALNDALPHDLENVSVSLQAWKDYINGNTGIPSFSVSPTISTYSPNNGFVTYSGGIFTLNYNKSIVPSSIGITFKDSGNNNVSSTILNTNFYSTITPNAPLISNNIYTVKVSGMFDTVGMSQFGTFSFTSTGVFIPIVISFYPSANSTVGITTPIYADFNKEVLGNTVHATITDTSGVHPPFNFSYSSGIFQANILPNSNLIPSDNYTINITGAISTDNGTSMSPFSWTFITAQLPRITANFPVNNSTVNSGTTISLSFNNPVNPSSMLFGLSDSGGNSIPFNTVYSNNSTKATLSYNGYLTPSDNYIVVFTSGNDTYGLPISGFTWDFNITDYTLVLNLIPVDNSVNNLITTPISVIFDHPIQTGTSTFTISSLGISVPGYPTYNTGLYKESFNNTYPLNLSTTYMATLSGLTNQFNIPLQPVQWSFATQSSIGGGNGKKYNIFISNINNVSNLDIIIE